MKTLVKVEKEECKHNWVSANIPGGLPYTACSKCGEELPKQDLTLEQKFEEYGELHRLIKYNSEPLAEIATSHFTKEIERAYQQGMKLSMGEAQRKLIEEARREAHDDGFCKGNVEGRKKEAEYWKDKRRITDESYILCRDEGIEEGKRQAIAEMKSKIDSLREKYRDFIIDEILSVLFGNDKC